MLKKASGAIVILPPKVAQNSSKSGQLWPAPSLIWPKLADLCLHMVESDQHDAMSSQVQSISGQICPKLPEFCPMVISGPTLAGMSKKVPGQLWPKIAGSGTYSIDRTPPILAKFARTRPSVGVISRDSGEIRSAFREFARPSFGNVYWPTQGPTPVSFARLCGKSSTRCLPGNSDRLPSASSAILRGTQAVNQPRHQVARECLPTSNEANLGQSWSDRAA